MASPRTTLTDDQLRQATEMRANGMAIFAIAAALGVPDDRVRKTIDPVYRERVRAEKARQHYRNRSRIDAGIEPIDRKAVRDAARLRQQIPPDTRGLTARIAGDPLKGRSALDKERGVADA